MTDEKMTPPTKSIGTGYDIIGDIHGCSRTLEALLLKLGYQRKGGVFRHDNRTAIFLGDFIDRQPTQRETIALVRPMIDAGSARAVMGNHEYNAISWFTRHPATSEPLRVHSEKNREQHEEFLEVYEREPYEYEEIIKWFKTLPIWLDLGELRIVHACWDVASLEVIRDACGDSAIINDDFLVTASNRDSREYVAIETVLKGKEIPLPDGYVFHDRDGHPRHRIRIKWWQPSANYQDAFLGPEIAITHLPDDEIRGDHLLEYGHDEPPVFIGHYWLQGDPAPLATNIACVDYSVANPGGKLVAYRWDGEKSLKRHKFVGIDRKESTS